MSADNILFRCSSLGYLMVNPKNKSELISETTKVNLVDIFIREHYNRHEEINSKFLRKGNEREEDSITLVSRVMKRMLRKNSTRLANEFISGEYDCDILEDGKIVETVDIKTSWSMHTFLRAKHKGLDPQYEWQGHGYMALTGAKRHTVAYCLVNGTHQAIMDEKRKLAYQYIDPDNSLEYLERCQQVEINHIFNKAEFESEHPGYQFDVVDWKYDVPIKERIHTFTIERDEEMINALYERIKNCRNWMNENLYA